MTLCSIFHEVENAIAPLQNAGNRLKQCRVSTDPPLALILYNTMFPFDFFQSFNKGSAWLGWTWLNKSAGSILLGQSRSLKFYPGRIWFKNVASSKIIDWGVSGQLTNLLSPLLLLSLIIKSTQCTIDLPIWQRIVQFCKFTAMTASPESWKNEDETIE